MKKPIDVDEYIVSFPKEIQKLLQQVRITIKKVAPQAEEAISYGMPLFKLHGRLAYFAAHTNHIGLYPMASGITAFKKELSMYKGAKGSVQFPFDKPLPISLITMIIKFRVAENEQKAQAKKK